MMRGELFHYWRVLELTVEAEIEAELTGDVFLAFVCGMAALKAASTLNVHDAEVTVIKREMALGIAQKTLRAARSHCEQQLRTRT
jgi:hypothetical protein